MNIKRLRFKVDTYFLFVGILFILTILSGVCLVSNITSATSSNSSEDNVAITIPVACTLVSSGNNSHSTNIVNGTYATDIGTTTLKVTCNDNQGFAIYAVGYTGDEIGVTNSTKLVGTEASSNTTIDTGTATGPVNNNDTSNWAMKLNTTTSPTPTYPITIDNSYNNYNIVPSSYTKVAHRDSGTDVGTNAIGSTLTTTYAAYISKLQYPDTYSGQVKYTLVHPSSEIPLQPQPAVPGYIVYHANASNVVGTMGNQSATDNSSVTLYASNFSRAGYGFAGWNDKYDYTGNFYGPNQSITVPNDTTANGLSLYAVWVPSAGSLQSDATAVCNGLTQDPTDGTANLSSVSALTDERDNQTYAIAKLADGNCWMIENLRLENTGAHNTDGTLAQGYNSSFIGLADPEYANFSSSTIANSLYSIDGSTSATISGSQRDHRFPRYNNDNVDSRQSSSSYSKGNNTYSYGNYYTWHAAIADITYYSSYTSGTTSICPAGWRLPIGDQSVTDKSFGKLSVSLGGPANGVAPSSSSTPTGYEMSNRFRNYPNNFLYSGYFNSSSAVNRGSSGHYWSSTVRADTTSYSLRPSISGLDPGTNTNYKSSGLVIRCILDVSE